MRDNNTTDLAKRLLDIHGLSKVELCKELGITRPSLDSRLSGKMPWKKLEKFWVNRLSKKRGVYYSKIGVEN